MSRKPKAQVKMLSHPSDKEAEVRKPFHAKVQMQEAYDPDKEYKDSEIISAEKRLGLSRVNVEAARAGKISVRGTFAVINYYKDGQIAEAQPIADGWKAGFRNLRESDGRVGATETKMRLTLKRVPNTQAFLGLTESNEWLTSKIIEAAGFDPFNYGDNLSGQGIVGPPNNEFIPLMGGPFSKNLYMYDFLDMQAKCFWSKNHDPFAKAIITMKRAFVIGKGVKLMFKNADCQEAWDAFEKRSKFQNKLRDDVETLVWGGEIQTEKIKGKDGRPSIKQNDPSTCWEVVTDPATPDDPIYFHYQYPTQWQLTYKAGDISSEYIINDVPADRVIFVKVNVTPGEKRGRSDLYPILSWMKRYRDYMNAKVVKAQMEESWALDISVDGNAADVEAIASANPINRIPPAGSTRVHNKDVEYNILQPSSSSTSGRDNVGDQIKTVIAIGGGIAPEWLGDSAAGSTKETARTKEGPAQVNIEDRQMVVENYIREVAEYVMAEDFTLPTMQVRPASLSKAKACLLRGDWKGLAQETIALSTGGVVEEPIDKSFEVMFPESQTEDRTAKIADIMSSERMGYISHQRAMSMVAKELGITDFDAPEEQQQIQAETDLGAGNPEWSDAAGKLAQDKGDGAPKPLTPANPMAPQQ